MLSFAVTSVAFAAVVSAQTVGYHAINLPGMQEVVPACAPYTIVWTPSDQYSGDVTFQLIGGASQATLVPIGASFGNVAGSAGSYTWDVPCDAGTEAIYGLKIQESSDLSTFQYSMPFQIKADDTVGTSTTGDTTATTSSADPKPTDTNTTSTAPQVTSGVPTTTAMNTTVTTQTPSQPITTLTSITTDGDAPTTTPGIPGSLASSCRITTGSLAMLAIAAAFLSL